VSYTNVHDSDVAGITTATSCRDLQCHNGGKCITAGSQNVQCSCQREYRGPYCEHRVSSCQPFRKSTADHGGFYHTKDSYEGSLTTWFCARGSHQEFGYSVCENRFHRPSWSNHPRCQSLITIVQRSLLRRKRSSSGSTDRTDLFESVNAWLIPVVVTCAAVIQIVAPFVIYCVLIGCCGYHRKSSKPFAKADKVEDKAIAAKYKALLEGLENRTPRTTNAVTVSQLHRIKQQLDEEVDQLRARRRQRDRVKRKIVKPLRVVSFYGYVSFWLWMVFLIVTLGAKLSQYGLVFKILLIIDIISVIMLPIMIFLESCCSAERQYIKNLSHLTSATERIESIIKNQPTVTMNAECYHYETHTRTVNSRTETYQERVVTARIHEPFLFTHWFDNSQSTLTDIHTSRITKIKMQLIVQFGDEATEQLFVEKYDQFQNENRHRDKCVDFSVSNDVAGFKKRLAAYTDPDNKPGWVSSLWFWLAVVFCVGWPYRIKFNRITRRTEYSVIKVIRINNSFTPAIPTASNQTPKHRPENVEGNSITTIKVNIQGIIDQLNAGLSENDGDIPIKCAATNEHINVTLQEAHHTPHRAK